MNSKLNTLRTILAKQNLPEAKGIFDLYKNFNNDNHSLLNKKSKISQNNQTFLIQAEDKTLSRLQGEMPKFNWLRQGKNIKYYFLYDLLFDDFIEENSHILAEFDPIKYLGSGFYGDVWLQADSTVLKVFKNDNDEVSSLDKYKNMAMRQSSGNGLPGDPMIYAYGDFKEPDQALLRAYNNREPLSLAYVVMEKVITVVDELDSYSEQNRKKFEPTKLKDLQDEDSAQYKDVIYDENEDLKMGKEVEPNQRPSRYIKNVLMSISFAVEEEFSNYKNNYAGDDMDEILDISKPKNQEDLIKEISNSIKTSNKNPTIKDIKNVEYMLGLTQGWLEKLIGIMVQNLIQGNFDLHVGNLGFRNNTPIFYDP